MGDSGIYESERERNQREEDRKTKRLQIERVTKREMMEVTKR